LALTGAVLWAVAAAEYAAIDPDGPTAGRARLFLNALAYILAVLLFGLVWNTRARSLISATVTLLVAAGLAFDLLWATRAAAGRVLLLALSVGLILAQSNWAINYWRTDVFTAAVSQLLVFYALVGLANQYLIDRLNRRVLIEFAAVMLIALILLLRGR
jgi:intracellular septation protein A